MSTDSISTACPPGTRPIGVEAGKTIARRTADGFVARYLSGPAILDIGYRGYVDAQPIVGHAIGVELDYPGYDGHTLPFGDQTQDAVFTSHCLEHIEDYQNAIREWHRVLKIGGHMIIAVPHKFLYEKRTRLPSRWNQDHKRFYTPASLLAEVEESLYPNTYRIRHCVDNDLDYDYSISPPPHAGGCYEIELVLERIMPPAWQLEDPPLLPHAVLGTTAPAQHRLLPAIRRAIPGRLKRAISAAWYLCTAGRAGSGP
jgi:SAM-dependent methyltransferase